MIQFQHSAQCFRIIYFVRVVDLTLVRAKTLADDHVLDYEIHRNRYGLQNKIIDKFI